MARLITLGLSAAVSASADDENLIPVCYNFGCKQEVKISPMRRDWSALAHHFAERAPDAAAERRQIAEAIAEMERVVGFYTSTGNDRGKNFRDEGRNGRMDCIDESINTTRYLKLFEVRGWLYWHRVMEREKRQPLLLDVHWTAVIEEVESGLLFAVDSWYGDNGEPPLVQALDEWKWSVAPNPEPAVN